MIKRVRSNVRKHMKVVSLNYRREMDTILQDYLSLCDAADEELTKADRVQKKQKESPDERRTESKWRARS